MYLSLCLFMHCLNVCIVLACSRMCVGGGGESFYLAFLLFRKVYNIGHFLFSLPLDAIGRL